MDDPLSIFSELRSAVSRGEPVVALESSVIAQGLPTKINVDTALAMEEEIRSAGAIPATIGVIDGRMRVGLTPDEIKRLGKGKAAKLAARDLPWAALKKIDGGTTVSATAAIACAAGIHVMATGGIGGVHRAFGESHDISADLIELTRTPVMVVCSGVKAILDVRATAEWLETHAVPVVGYQTDELPSFYSDASGVSIPKLEGPDEAAALAGLCSRAFGMRCGLVVAVRPPKDAVLDVSEHIQEALREAAAKGIRGAQLTPWLLSFVAKKTEGASVSANISLLKNNARAAAAIAVASADCSRARMGFVDQ